MVLGHQVGKPRGFLRGFLLTIASVGFYAVYWNYKAHSELYKQFELAREDRDEGVIWYILGLIFPPLVFAYLWTFASNVAYLRQRMLLPRRTTPASFLVLLGIGLGTFLMGWFALLVLLAVAEAANGALDENDPALAATAMLFFVGLLLFVTLGSIAYYRLQRDINEVWSAYGLRVAQLSAAPPVGRLAPAPELAPHPTYWADLAPRQAEEGEWMDRPPGP